MNILILVKTIIKKPSGRSGIDALLILYLLQARKRGTMGGRSTVLGTLSLGLMGSLNQGTTHRLEDVPLFKGTFCVSKVCLSIVDRLFVSVQCDDSNDLPTYCAFGRGSFRHFGTIKTAAPLFRGDKCAENMSGLSPKKTGGVVLQSYTKWTAHHLKKI